MTVRGRERAWILVPFAAGILFSLNTMPGDFVFDDQVVVQKDERLKAFDLRRIFRENYWGRSRTSPNYRPLTLLSYAVNRRLSDEAWAFHAVNTLLNGLAAAVFFLVLGRLLGNRPAAAIGASLFAALPIHSEAVANVVGRAEMLAAIPVLLAWWCALRAEGREGPGTLVAVALLVASGMCAKENAIVAAALIPASGWILRRPFPWKSALAACAGFVIYAALRQALLILPEGFHGGVAFTDNPLAREPLAVRILNAWRLLGLYALRTALPIHLSADHSFNEIEILPLSSPLLWGEVTATTAALAVPVIAGFLRPGRRLLALGPVVFLLAIGPTANIFFSIGTIFGERLAYLPSAGWCILLLGVLASRERVEPQRTQRVTEENARPPLWSSVPSVVSFRTPAVAALSILVLAYGLRTWTRNRVWANPWDFGIQLALDAPNSTRAHDKAAEGHLILSRRAESPEEREREFAAAEAEVAEALRIYPLNSGAKAFRAYILLERKRHGEALAAMDEAEASYQAEKVEPDPDILYVRAEILYNLDRFSEARALLDRYLERMGISAKAMNLRGVTRLRTGDAAGARADLDRAVAIDPRNATARMNRGILLASAGELAAARADLDEAANRDPKNLQVFANRGYLRFLQKDPAGAIEDYRTGESLCLREGLIAQERGDSVLGFKQRIFDVLRQSGDLDGARRELRAIEAIPSPLAKGTAAELGKLLPPAAEGAPR